MSGDFFDSNVFIYFFDEKAAEKQRKARQLVRNSLADHAGCISFQVVQETLNVITTKIESPATIDEAREFLAVSLIPLWTIMPSEELYRRALELLGRYRYAFYDSLIIAAALESGCTRLYSEDLQDGQRIERLTIVNPFAE